FARRKRFLAENGVLTAERNREFRRWWGATHPNLEPTRESTAEINTSIRYGDRFELKLLRNVEPGPNPAVEMGRLLTEEHPFPNAAPFAGSLEYSTETGEVTTLGVLDGFVQNEG